MDVSLIQQRIAAIVDQSSTAPTAGGDSWNLRLNYLNMAQQDWKDAYDWSVLYKESNSLASTSTSGPTVSTPIDFDKLAGYPKITADGSNTDEYPEIDSQTKEQYSGSDIYCYTLADNTGKRNIIINPATLVSGASVFIPYWSALPSLASPADISLCPNPNYLIQRTIAYLWEGREDPRFPQAKRESDKLLQRMVENENVRGWGYNNKARNILDKTGFRWGK